MLNLIFLILIYIAHKNYYDVLKTFCIIGIIMNIIITNTILYADNTISQSNRKVIYSYYLIDDENIPEYNKSKYIYDVEKQRYERGNIIIKSSKRVIEPIIVDCYYPKNYNVLFFDIPSALIYFNIKRHEVRYVEDDVISKPATDALANDNDVLILNDEEIR